MKEIKSKCTCYNHFVVCVLFDRKGSVISRETRRCKPEAPYCHETDECNVIPAEVMALYAVPQGCKPYKALIAGKNEIRSREKEYLHESGVVEIKIISMEDLKPFLDNS